MLSNGLATKYSMSLKDYFHHISPPVKDMPNIKPACQGSNGKNKNTARETHVH